jgi:hypothetical protein
VGFFNALCRNPVDAGTFPKALKKSTPFGRFLCLLAFAVGKPLATLVGSYVIFMRTKGVENPRPKMVGICCKVMLCTTLYGHGIILYTDI